MYGIHDYNTKTIPWKRPIAAAPKPRYKFHKEGKENKIKQENT